VSERNEGSEPEASELGFDKLMESLQQVVARLESGSLSLEESLAAYEEGVSLARRGHALLDGAEKRVELLVRDSSGQLTSEPVGADGEDG
jgi:exodeoxyribonuclease VII small subunit